MRKSKAGAILGIIVLAGLIIGLLFVSIKNLSGAGEYVEKDVIAAGEAFSVKKSYAFIPIATEHYYYGLTTEGEILIIKGDDKWYDKNFDYEGLAKNGDCVSVKGTKSSLSSEAKKGVTSVGGYQFVDNNRYSAANVLYKKQAIQCIVLVVVGIALGVAGAFLSKAGMTNQGTNKNIIGTVFGVVVLVFIFFALKSIMVMF